MSEMPPAGPGPEGEEAAPPCVLLTVSLLGLETVRALLGRPAADAVRAQLVARLETLADTCTVHEHQGEDEVSLACPGGEADGVELAGRVQQVVAEPVSGETPARITALVGIASSAPSQDAGPTDAETLQREADTARAWLATRDGETVAAFRPHMREELAERADMAIALGTALAGDDELFLEYQPVIDLTTRRVVAVEALARWRRPGHGLVPPAEFIPVAEQSRQITDLGRWVLDRAVSQLAQWQRLGGPAIRLHVNLSAAELQQPCLVDQVSSTLARHGVPASSLLLEVTETGLLTGTDDPVVRLEEIRGTGVAIGIDDFGTGYSSISYLRELPLDLVKLDRSLTSLVGTSSEEYALTRAIFSLLRSSGVEVVAEGIEEPVQVAHLRAMRCKLGQGFLLARPTDADQVGRLLLANSA